ncbi:MAG: ribosomal protein L11 methyltransferase [candidate division Zixibacteria bacterium RBG_16_50_21]|nr:MAG: ribosomal protein L11 methyltransferase [candidate division Zixibacteria bacterium RBG_16_50_21]
MPKPGYYYLLEVRVPREFEEAASNFLLESGSSGIKIDQNHKGCVVSGYFDKTDLTPVLKKTEKYLGSLSSLFPQRFKFSLAHNLQRTQDWSEKWRKSFKPVLFGKEMAVVPSWEKRKFRQRLVIKIFPQMAFGIGTHPTTQMCLWALSRLVRSGCSVLDLGTGSGILAIAAVKLGCDKVTAIDKDPEIEENAKKNFRLNKVEEKIDLKIVELTKIRGSERFDLAVANLTGREIFGVFRTLKSRVKPNGRLIISGWTKEDSPELLRFLKVNKVKVNQKLEKKGWVTFICKS